MVSTCPTARLTRWVREADLRGPPRRAGEYDFVPGQEMQHDTSPHRVAFANSRQACHRAVRRPGAGLLAPAVHPILPAVHPLRGQGVPAGGGRFMAGVCPVCIIDNTSVLLAAGAGADAVIAPEMAAFARTLGFRFRAHRVGIPTAKAGSSAPSPMSKGISWPAAASQDFDDLNRQAVAWCRDVANHEAQAGARHVARSRLRHREAAPRAAARCAAAGLRVAGTRRRSARLCLGRHQSLFRPRALRRQVGRRLQAAGRDPCLPQGHARSPFTGG